MMTYENYRKMKEFSRALAESFHNAEIKVEIMEIVSKNSPVTAKEIAEIFNKKFAFERNSWGDFYYFHVSKYQVAQHIQKLITMGKVRISEQKMYPVNVTPYSENPTYITGCTCVYTVA